MAKHLVQVGECMAKAGVGTDEQQIAMFEQAKGFPIEDIDVPKSEDEFNSVMQTSRKVQKKGRKAMTTTTTAPPYRRELHCKCLFCSS